nr:PREDICTED: uncharacterized protein LOC105671151 [Linepithema humile]
MVLLTTYSCDFMWATELNRCGLELVGLWPKIDEKVKNNFVSDLRVCIVFIIVTFLSVVPLVWSLVRVWGDMLLMIDNLQVTLPLIVVSMKLLIIRWKRSAIAFIIKMIAEDWKNLKVDSERDVMIRRARASRLIVICGYALMVFVFSVLIVLPTFGLHFRYLSNLTDGDRLLPFQAYYFYDTDKSPQFELTLIIQAMTMFFGAITYTSVDAFLGLAIFHICGQLENFRHRLFSLTSCKDFDGCLPCRVGFPALVFDMDISERSSYKDFVWAVELNCLSLKLIGLWPKTDEVTKDNYASDLRVGIIFVIVTFVSGIPLICSLIRVWGDMLLMVDNLQVTLPLLIVSLKLVVMRCKRSALSSIIKMMAEDWMELKTTKERDVMRRQAQIARAIVISGYVLMVLAFIVVIVLPYFGLSLRHLTNLTDPGKPLPLQTYYFYDTDKSPQFELTIIVQAITIFLAAVTYTSVDAFLGLAILHFCGQLENFKGRVAVLTSCQNFFCTLNNNVKRHLRLIKFANTIEDTFSLMLLSLVFYFGIVFCLHGFLLLTVVTEEDLSFQRLCFPLISITILISHTFLYCGAGEIVTMQLLKTSAGYISFLLAKRG